MVSITPSNSSIPDFQRMSHNLPAFSQGISLKLPMLLLAAPMLVFLASLLVILVWSASVAFRYVHLRKSLLEQGLDGPPPKFLIGNMHQVSEMRELATSKDMRVGDHDLLPRICPHFTYWSAIYGKRFLFWWGMEPRITVVEPEMIKEILSTKAEHFGKSLLLKKGGVLLLGNGMVYANGESWAHRRRIVGPAFHAEMLKKMVPEMVASTSQMLGQWSQIIDNKSSRRSGDGSSAEIDINYYLSMATADVIARTAFSSTSSHEKGKRVFQLLTCLQKVFAQSNRFLWLPCNRMLPTAANRRASRIKRDMERALRELVLERRAGRQKHGYGSDFLGLMLSESERDKSEAAAAAQQFDTPELVEECKTIFFTGHETTSALLTWTLMLLALNPEWQQRGRAEVMEHLPSKSSVPDADVLPKLKILGMILNEVLRLYPPAPALVRESLVDLSIQDVKYPRGTTFWIPIVALHHSKDVWGDDALHFNPARFADGVAAACKLQHQKLWSFMPFSLGPRACLGQSFAMMEAKVVLAMILQRFEFKISPNYRHAPVTAITLKPRYGMQLMLAHYNIEDGEKSPG
ncbi:cytokinin hydroxylase [Selaginella moellendorffii]|nr:cytokinin hydroxylase [Selaginella moellendorffii]|eukprot:XP_002967823.2 cytokinin hydroxylase [Selaginella moellendorffii]